MHKLLSDCLTPGWGVFRKLLFALFFLFSPAVVVHLYAQIDEWLFQREHIIDPEKKGELLFELDNLSFFKNNEFEGDYQKGYTLPGLWVRPKLVYYPLHNMKIELGLNLLRYWGTNYYPNATYIGIPAWSEDKASRGIGHLLPFLRFQVALYKNVNVVLGNIYGGASHQLAEPLYNPEYNFTSDPEAGLQLLFDYRHFMLDGWVNWQDFIYNGDDHQEMFKAGVSSKIKFMRPETKFQVNLPLQMVFHHQGGEIDGVDASVKTWLNAGTGMELSYYAGRKYLTKLDFSLMGFYSSQQAGHVLPVGEGWGVNAKLSADVKDFRISAGYWKCDDFFTISGSPFFGSISQSKPGKTFDKPSMVYGTLEYTRQFGSSFAFGGDVSVYHHLSALSKELVMPAGGIIAEPLVKREKAATSITIGVYLRINPSILLKKF